MSRPSNEIQRVASYGRGGAGTSPSPSLSHTHLESSASLSHPPPQTHPVLTTTAGNIGTETPNSRPSANDLVTPTLKSDLYTTGRGGTGNMARNDPKHPEIARASQDVEAPAHAHRDPEGRHHFGRGGAANVAQASPELKPTTVVPGAKGEESGRRGSEGRGSEDKGLVGKGKDLLNRLKK